MKIVKIGTHDLYPEIVPEIYYRDGIVAVGWSEIGNLEGLTKQEIAKHVREKLSKTKGSASRIATELVCFRDEIDIGDIVIS